jgi:excisionase family DNA binding protein
MLEGYLTTRQASEMYRLTDSHFRRLLEHGTIQGIKAGRDWLIDKESLEQYMANRPKPGRKPKSREDKS